MTVYIKVKYKKSAFFLIRWNVFAVYVILMLNGIINWDVVIAKYNFSHYHKSFVHLDFMARLSDKALPYLDKTEDELENIRNTQKELFFSSSSFSVRKYMTPEDYHDVIGHRMREFKAKRDRLSWLSWTLADHKAYKYCKENSEVAME